MNDPQTEDYLQKAQSLVEAGDVDGAIRSFQLAVEGNPANVKAHFGLGNAYGMARQFEKASTSFGVAISLNPKNSAAFFNKANMDRALGNLDGALAGYKAALKLRPHAAYFNNLGTTLSKLDRMGEACQAFQDALNLDLDFVPAHVNLVQALYKTKNWPACQKACQCALKIAPENSDVLFAFGRCNQEAGELEQALEAFSRAVVSAPRNVDFRLQLASFLRHLGRLGESSEHCRVALDLAPSHAKGHSNFGEVLRLAGFLDDALKHQRRALQLDPTLSETHSNLLLTSMYRAQIRPADLLAESKNWATQHAQHARRFSIDNVTRTSRPRLRIGYISGNFHDHPVGIFLEPVLRFHNHATFEIYCYANQTIQDARTQRLRGYSDHWAFVVDDTDEELAARISHDAIDILVDLSGHTAGNRLTALAYKPAPIQVTWMGFSSTTGLSAIDYILADKWVIPVGEEQYYVERVERLPDHYVCFEEPRFEVEPVANRKAGHEFTFGCFNNMPKICSAVIETWASILRQTEHSRLVIKTPSLDDPWVRKCMLEKFSAHGVSEERIHLQGHSPRKEFLNAYKQIDVSLDPFPFNGGITSLESLWMGVPVLTVKGDRFTAHASESFLCAVGLESLVAPSRNAYIDLACRLATDPEMLNEFRRDLRVRLLSSPLGKHQQFTKDLEDVYGKMWTRFSKDSSSHK